METDYAERRRILYEFILTAKRDQAVQSLLEVIEISGFESMVHEVLEPVLVEIGEKWMAERISLAQGYVAGKVAEEILLRAGENGDKHSETLKGPAVLCCIEDDHHALGRKMVATFLRSSGWNVVDMGNDIPASDLVDKAVEVGARVIGASAMMYTTAMNIRSVRKELVKRGLEGRVQLAVGGAIFNLRPELVAEVGGDGTAPNAIKAPQLFDQLYEKSCQAEKGETP